MTGTAKVPAVGDSVWFEGLPHKITGIDTAGNKIEFESDLQHEGKARFRTLANLSDIRWHDEIGHWHLWGRLLSKGRGGVGIDHRSVVSELRDRGLLPSKAARERGHGPTGGEHHHLHVALFKDPSINWTQELGNVRTGEGLSTKAKAAIADFAERFKRDDTQALEHYAPAHLTPADHPAQPRKKGA